MLAEGTYRARCTGEADAQFGYSANGNEQLALLFELVDEHGEPTGERITWIGFFTEKGLPITYRALEVCGWHGDNLIDLSGIEKNEVELVIRHEDYEGQTYARVAFVNKPGAGGRMVLKNQMDAGARAAFAAKMRGAILAEKQRAGTSGVGAARTPARSAPQRGAPRQAPPGQHGADEDIPF